MSSLIEIVPVSKHFKFLCKVPYVWPWKRFSICVLCTMYIVYQHNITCIIQIFHCCLEGNKPEFFSRVSRDPCDVIFPYAEGISGIPGNQLKVQTFKMTYFPRSNEINDNILHLTCDNSWKSIPKFWKCKLNTSRPAFMFIQSRKFQILLPCLLQKDSFKNVTSTNIKQCLDYWQKRHNNGNWWIRNLQIISFKDKLLYILTEVTEVTESQPGAATCPSPS